MSGGTVARRLAWNTGTLVGGGLLGQGAKGLIAIAVGRELGPDQLGVFTFVWTVAALVAQYAPLGIGHLLVRELSRERSRVAWGDALRVAVALNLLATAALVGGARLFGAGDEILRALVVAAPYVLLSPIVIVYTARFHARERMGLDAVVQVVEGATALLGALVALRSGLGLVGVLAALGAGRAAGAGTAWWLDRRLPPLPAAPPAARTPWREVVTLSLPMGGASLFTALVSRADLVILGLLVAATDVGIYGAAAVVVALLADTTNELNRAAYPRFSRMAGPGFGDGFAQLWRLQMLFTTAAATGLSVLAGPIVGLLFGDGFDAAARVLAVLAWILPLRTLGHLCGIGLFAVDRAGARTRATGVAAALNVTANLALVPVLGLWGAVVAAIVTDAVLLALSAHYARDLRPAARTGLATSLMVGSLVAAVAALTPGHVLVRIAAGGVVFLGAAATTRTGRDTIHSLRTAVPS
ncbi:MAG TPA: oligosaccharide flippase family protein [Egicoccus sp.]|nr:oligosaccharide flippase family protein [Egicoccus sp.]HSK22900.1 oligosaccharide flippase family protein [Egicoccus sp.]